MTSTQGQSQLTSSSAPAPQEEESLVTRPSNAPPAGKPVLARRGPAGRQVASGGAAAAMPAGGSRTGSSSPATTSSPTTNDAPLTAAKQQEIYDAARQRIFDESHQDDSEQVAASTAASKAVARHAVEHEEAHEYKRDPVVRTRGRGGGGGGGGGSYGPGMGAAPQYPPSSGEFANYYAWQQHQIGRHTGYDASAMPQEHQYYQPPPHHMYGGATEGMYPPHQHHHHHHQHHYPQNSLDPEYQRYGNDYGGSNNNSRRGRGGGGYNQGGGYNDQVPAYGDYQDPSLGRSNQRGRGLRPGRGGAGAYGGYDDAYGMQAPAPHVALNSRFDPSAPAWEGSGATRSHASHNPGPHVPPAMSQPWTDPRYGGHEHHASRGVGAPRVPPSPAASYPMPPMMRPPNEGQFHVGPPPPAHEMFPELHHKAQAGAAAMAPPHGNPRRNDYPSHDALAPAPRQEPTQPYYQTPGQQPHQQHHAPPPRHYPQEGQYSAGGGLAGAAPAMRQPAPTPQQQQQQQQPPLPSLAAPSGGMLSVRVGVAPPVVPFGFQAPPPQHQAPIFQQHQHHGQAIPHEAPPPAPAQAAPAPQPQPTNHTVGPSPLSLAMSRKSLQPTATPAA